MDFDDLLDAVLIADLATLGRYLDEGVPVDRLHRGLTLLMLGIGGGNEKTIEMLLERGADIRAKDRHGNTPLAHAVFSNRTTVAERLIDLGADVNQVDDKGNTPLHYALVHSKGDPSMIRMLLRQGADPDHRNAAGLSCRQIVTEYRGEWDYSSLFR